MREILFRGQRVGNRKWVRGDLVHGRGSYKGRVYICKADAKTQYKVIGFEVVPETIGQYLEVRDRKQKRIFKGDIVRKTNNGRHPKIFVANECAPFYTQEEVYYGPFEHFTEPCEYEIIGNIHDNPELLKGE